jgi:hypothetical protein
MPRQSSRLSRSLWFKPRRWSGFARPRCEELEGRIAPALFDVQDPQFFPSMSNNGCVAVADLDKDGDSDAIFANFGTDHAAGAGSSITVLYSNGAGGFTRVPHNTQGFNVAFVTTADINGDTYQDVVAVNANKQGTGSVTVFENDKNGNLIYKNTFSTFGRNSSWVGLADVTDDGVLDVLVASFGADDGTGEGLEGNNATIFQGNKDASGNGDFTFVANPITTLNPEVQFIPTAMAVADFTGDGKQDIAAVSPGVPLDFESPYPNGTLYLFEGTGAGGFLAPETAETAGVLPINIQAAHLNADTRLDLVIANAGDPNSTPEWKGTSVGVLLNISTTKIAFGVPNGLTTNTYGTFAVAVADFDMNGKNDIAAVNFGAQDFTTEAFVSVYMGSGTGSFTPETTGTYDTKTTLRGGQYLAVGDFDKKGNPDLIVAHESSLVGLMLNTTVPAPTVTINQAQGQADPTNVSPVKFDVVFSTGVTGFDATDISFAGSSLGNLQATVTPIDDAKYTVTVTGMSGTGTVQASIAAGAATSKMNGTSSLASTSSDNTVTFDNVVPTVTIEQAAGQADPAATGPIKFTVIFSEAVTGFAAGDVDLSASSLSGLSATVTANSSTNYTVSVTGMSGNGTVVAKVVAAAAKDPAGNDSAASTSNDNTVTFGSAPTVTINQAQGQADPTNATSIKFDVVFSMGVTGFDGTDVSFAGSSLANLSATVTPIDDSKYTVSVTGMTGAGTVQVSIPAGAATSIAGSIPSGASTSNDNTVTFDGIQPSVTINQAPGQDDPTSVASVKFAVKFSEPVTGFGPADISFAGSTVIGSLSANVTGSGDSYTVTVTGMTGRGFVVASVPAGGAADGVGNGNLVSSSNDNSVEFVSPGTLGFAEAVFSTPEDPGVQELTVTVTRTGDFEGPVSIKYATSDGTAHSGGSPTAGQADYTPTSGTLTWDDGIGGDKTFKITILHDSLNEGKELINLVLTDATGGPALGLTSAAVAIDPSDGQVIDARAKLPAATFFDAAGLGGDKVTVRLAGRAGTATVYLTDPDGDRTGPIEWIELANTSPLISKMTVTVKKPRGGFGDGRSQLAEVSGSGLLALTAPKTDLTGVGIHLDGFLRGLTIGHVTGGADITMGPPPVTKLPPSVRIKAGVIGDDTDINVTARLASLNAISFGDGSITAPRVGSIIARGIPATLTTPRIPGSFESDVLVTGAGVTPTQLALTLLRVTGNIESDAITVNGNAGSISVGARAVGNVTGTDVTVTGNMNAFRVAGRVDQTTVDVTGNVKTVAVGSFWNSRLDAGYTGPDDGTGTYDFPAFIGKFTVASRTNGFQSSHVIASTINSVVLASVNPDNAGTPFGFIANQALKALRVTSPTQFFVFNPFANSPQTTPALGDFRAIDRNGPLP